jgi:hypothetical protein
MPQILINDTDKIISVSIPLTANSGKIQIKNRSMNYRSIFKWNVINEEI